MSERHAGFTALKWRGWLARVALLCCLLAPGAQACTIGACVTAGPRLASVNTANSALLNGLLGSLLGGGTGLNLSVLDWNTIAQSDISLSAFLNALQVQTSTATPAAALGANASLLQVLNAAASAATADGKTAAATALNHAIAQIGALSGSIRLGDMLSVNLPTGALATSKINVLELLTGSVQLFNYKNVATTPAPIGLSLSALNLSSTLTQANLYAQVVEPPVYICGGSGAQFYSAAIRIKLNLTLLTLTPDTALLNAVAGLLGTSVTLGQLQLYIDVARAQGTITAVNSLASAVGIQAGPGVANAYLGTMTDGVWFSRTHVVNPATDLSYANIGNLTVKLPIVGDVVVAIQAKSAALGIAPLSQLMTFNGPYPQTQVVGSSSSFIANLLNSLVTNLQLQLIPTLGTVLDTALLTPLKTIVNTAITPLLSAILTSVVDPLLQLLGIGIGQMQVTVGGAGLTCSLGGYGYSDINHNATRDHAEAGCGETLYAKLIPAATPAGPAQAAVAIDTGTGVYGFADVSTGNYTVIVDNNNTLADVAPNLPAGWIGTEAPAQTRSVRVITDVANQNFGLFNGSNIAGMVFRDSGGIGAVANNGVLESVENTLPNVMVKAVNSGNSTLYDSTTTAGDGSYLLWLPAAAGAATVDVIDVRLPPYIAVSGNAGTTSGTFMRAQDKVQFVNSTGSRYTGVNFGVVPDNSFTNDNQQTILPGAIALYPHVFIAGTTGQLTLTSTATATPTDNWTQLIYRDTNCNGAIDSGEVAVNGAIATNADQKICIVVKAQAPATAAVSARYTQSVGASFVYSIAAFTAQQNRTDITTVGGSLDAGLSLVKSVDKATAKTGDVITYTIRYENKSSGNLQNLKIFDTTPDYTVFASATCGTTPPALAACTVTTKPAVSASGPLQWTFGGALVPGAFGTVVFSVTLE